VEENGNKSMLCRRRFHPETTKVRTIYSPNGEQTMTACLLHNSLYYYFSLNSYYCYCYVAALVEDKSSHYISIID